MSKILALPGGFSESLEFLKYHVSPDLVVGASSLMNDPVRSLYPDWTFLPFMHDESFLPSLVRVVEEKQISEIFCPHDLIHEKINRLIADGKITVRLANRRPTDHAYIKVEHVNSKGQNVFDLALKISTETDRRDFPPVTRVSSWLGYSDSILGHSSNDKLSALLAALSQAPEGDVVEIGSYWGKSSAWLAFVADFFSVGPLLSVDPWTNENAVQNDSPLFLKEALQENVANHAFEGFLQAMGVAPDGTVNYYRMPSDQAFHAFQKSRTVHSEVFGETQYSGKLSLLHIDGNHDYAVVCSDRDLWCPMVQSGGWIVFDDYVWEHGSGPARAGNEFLDENRSRIARSFVCGKALFIQMK